MLKDMFMIKYHISKHKDKLWTYQKQDQRLES